MTNTVGNYVVQVYQFSGSPFVLLHIAVYDHVKWVARHHGMTRPQVAGGGKASRYRG